MQRAFQDSCHLERKFVAVFLVYQIRLADPTSAVQGDKLRLARPVDIVQFLDFLVSTNDVHTVKIHYYRAKVNTKFDF